MTVTGLPPLFLHATRVTGGASGCRTYRNAHLSHFSSRCFSVFVFFLFEADEGFDFIRRGKRKYRQWTLYVNM